MAARAQQLGHDVRVVAATLVRALGVGQRGRKTTSGRADIERSVVSHRVTVGPHSVVGQPRGESDLRLPRSAHQSSDAARESGAQLVRSRLGQPLRATPDVAQKVRRALLLDAEGLPAHLERLLVVLETLSEQIADADAELKALAAEDARMRRLMTVPGVGPVTAARFVAALDEVERFPNASSVASSLGLVPGEDTTGFRVKRKRMTRAGAPQVRWALGQAAWSFIFAARRIPMAQWAKRYG